MSKVNKFLQNEVASLNDFLFMVEAYEEIAALRMRKVKSSVLARRNFMHGLNDAFAYIVYAYRIYRKSIVKTLGEDTILNTNGKTVSVFLASNTGLYGDIIRDVFNLFAAEVSKVDTDVVIVGRLGRSMYDNYLNHKDYTFFEISDTGVDQVNIKKLLESLTDYSSVVMYHSVFKSVLKQEAQKTWVTGEVLKIAESLENHKVGLFFEPSVAKIAEYFEKQILSLLFEQTVFESSLGKFAARMISLDASAANIHQKLSYYSFALQKSKHKALNSNMQGTLAGGFLWN